MLTAQIFSGAGVGLLLGMLLGLSSSPVVSLVVGALAALLASLVGIRVPGKEPGEAPTEATSAAQRRAAAYRAGVFGFTCLLGLLGGISLRTHNALSPVQPSLKQQVDELVSVGFSAVDARRIAVLHSLDAGATEGKSSDATRVVDTGAMLRKTILFASAAESCDRLSVDRFKDVEAAIAAYKTMDEPALVRIAVAINQQRTDEKARMELLRSVVEALCARR
jgi:hypothetical protein